MTLCALFICLLKDCKNGKGGFLMKYEILHNLRVVAWSQEGTREEKE
jgi:hypothetical protein